VRFGEVTAISGLCYSRIMKTVGIIVEYNPLHFGHVHHFREAKKVTGAEAVVAVMSGHFLQRGEPAIIGKWARAEAALALGADVVIELPVRYSSAPAEWFAYGAVRLLDATRVVDALCFGSESGHLSALARTAKLLALEPDAFRRRLRLELKTGISYPSAYEAALASVAAGESPDIGRPNNNLGLHYLIALERLGSPIVPHTIPRIQADYHDTAVTDHPIASATAIRKLVGEGGLEAASSYLPAWTMDILRREFAAGRGPVTWESLAVPLVYRLSTASAEELARFDEVDEGLEHRVMAVLGRLRDEPLRVERLLDALKTKRYTRTKLQRMLVRILLEQPKAAFTRSAMVQGPACIRVLGFSERGKHLLKKMKREATLPVITRIGRDNAALVAEDIRATAVYALAFRDPDAWQLRRDYYQAPIIAEDIGSGHGGGNRLP